jgi:hypothetical protein
MPLGEPLMSDVGQARQAERHGDHAHSLQRRGCPAAEHRPRDRAACLHEDVSRAPRAARSRNRVPAGYASACSSTAIACSRALGPVMHRGPVEHLYVLVEVELFALIPERVLS